MFTYSFIVIPVVFTALLFLERIFPLRKANRAIGHRLLVNASLSFLTFGIVYLLVRPASLGLLHWNASHLVGIVPLFRFSSIVQGVLGFLLLDLTFYYWHRLNHSLPFLWRFHNVHHFDPDLDISTGFRFHFGEVALSVFFRAAQVLIVGAPISTFLAYEFVFQLGTFFHHSNVRLPFHFEKMLNWIIVTPRMHGIHHSQVQEETNSNYSVVFSFWDRLHRSFRWAISQSEIKIGVPGYNRVEDNSLRSVVRAPFEKQREYWSVR